MRSACEGFYDERALPRGPVFEDAGIRIG